MRGERPWIGVVGGLELGERPAQRGRVTIGLGYVEAIERAGGAPVLVPPTADLDRIPALLERFDGLLFPGGDDFDTARLGLGPTHPAASPVPALQQDFDLALARSAVARGKPVLGVCYGMQVLGLAHAARLHQHLPEHPRSDGRPRRKHEGGVQHDVRAEPGTKLAACLGVEPVSVISRHHQALADPGAGWIASATDDEGLIEAIERPGAGFAVGVQWHPELAGPDEVHGRLFEALVEAAREARSER